MRLKTKFQDEDFELGEVVEANIYYGGSGRIKVIAEPVRGGMITFYFETLKGMNEMFEDAEEPKKYWYIDIDGEINCGVTDNIIVKEMKEIGNYFETKEEAEKAVEKLKALKRLKDKGLEFDGWILPDRRIGLSLPASFFPCKGRIDKETEKDLDLLFGGEE